MKRREAEKEMEEREDIEIRQKKAETDQMFYLYQQEKDKKRNEDAQALADYHLKQAVNSYKKIFLHLFVFFFIATTKRS